MPYIAVLIYYIEAYDNQPRRGPYLAICHKANSLPTNDRSLLPPPPCKEMQWQIMAVETAENQPVPLTMAVPIYYIEPADDQPRRGPFLAICHKAIPLPTNDRSLLPPPPCKGMEWQLMSVMAIQQ